MSIIYILLAITAYLIGSIPTAFLIVKKFTGKNILEYGTGNVGTMNTHRTTNNKYLTLLVLLVDISKGCLVYFSSLYLISNFVLNLQFALGLSGFFVILGHNYSIFLKLKGGKGLATAMGFVLFLNPVLILVWGLIFTLITFISKYMVLGQLVASIFIPLITFYLFPEQFLIVLPFSILVILKHLPRLINIIHKIEPKMYYKI